MIKFQVALLAECIESTKTLAQASHLELKNPLPYDPDWQLLVTLEQRGCLKLYQVVMMGVVVGIAVVILSPSTHHKGLHTAVVDCIFIRPHNRGVGKQFLSFIEEDLRQEGVTILSLGLPPQYGDAPSFLDKEHYHKTDHLFTRTL